MNSTARQRWEARNTETQQIVSAPYYVGAAAKRVARTAANETGIAHEVLRNGLVWERIEPAKD